MRNTLVDSSVLLDLFTGDRTWKEWTVEHLERAVKEGLLFINDIIYTEISVGFSRIEDFETTLASLPIEHIQIPKNALFLAGKAFLNYRRKKKTKKSPLPDFYIGAHAAVENYRLLTRDPKRVRSYFPNVSIISP
jgi:predicted nucleic acid-binding protein